MLWQVGSDQALLFCASNAALAHQLHGVRIWQRVRGEVFLADARLQLLNLAHQSTVRAALASLYFVLF
jgi:hypothetical protein